MRKQFIKEKDMEGDEIGKVTEISLFTVTVKSDNLSFILNRIGEVETWDVGTEVKINLRDSFLNSYDLEATKSKGFSVRSFARTE